MMRMCNDTITVFNQCLDPDTGYEVYKPSVIKNVSWYSHVESTVTNDGLKAANKITIRIPIDADFDGKAYVLPVDYTGGEGEFTLRSGDYVIKGSEAEPLTPAQARERYGEIATILGVTDNRRAPRAKHWRVVGG